MRKGALRRSVSLAAMGVAVAAGLGGGALANCVTVGSATTCNTAPPNPFTSRVGSGGAMSVTVNAGAGIDVSNGDGAIWNSSGAITNNGSISASGGVTPAIRIETNLHTNNGAITGSGVVAIQRAAGATGIASFSNSAGATITSTGVANAILDLGAGTFSVTNRGTINGGVSMGPGIDNLNLYPGSVITGAIDGGSDGAVDALSLYGPGTGTVDSAVSGFETLTVNGGRWTFNNALTGVTSSSIQNGGTLVLNAPSSITGQMFIRPGGTLETSAANFPASTLDNGGLVRFAEPAGSASFARTITGPGAVEKTGPGTLTLTADNTFSGGLTVSGGVLAASKDAALGAVSGGMTVNGGTFRYLSGFALDPARALTMGSSSGTFDTNGFATAITGPIGGPGSLTKTGSGTLTLSGSNSYSGGTTVNAGTLAAGANSALGAPSSTLTLDGGTFRYLAPFGLDRPVSLGPAGGTIDTNGFSTTIAGIVSGSGRLTKTGAGVLTLTGTNSHQGGTEVIAGVLAAGTDAALGTAAGALTLDGGTFRYLAPFGLDRPVNLGAAGGSIDTNGFDAGIARGIAGPGRLTKTGAGTLTLAGENGYAGGTTIAQGTLQIGSGGTTGAISGDVTNNGRLVFNRADAVVFDGVISGTGSVTQAGTGVLRLAADNSYAGGTFVTGGVLEAARNAVLGSPSGALTLDGGTFRYAAAFGLDRAVSLGAAGGSIDTQGFASTISRGIAGPGRLTKTGAGTLTLTGENSYAGGTTIAQGTLQIGDGGTTGSITGDVANGGSLVFRRSDAVTFGGSISGAGSVTQAGTGVLRLEGTNSYAGGTFVTSGVLQAARNGALGDAAGPLTLDGGTFRFGGSFDLDRPVSLGAAGGGIDTQGFAGGIGGIISGSGAMTKTGAGTLTLTGANSYTGGTTIAQGTLQLGDGGTTGTIIGDVANDGTLVFNRADRVDFAGVISGAGGVTQAGSGTTVLAGEQPYRGPTRVAAGTLAIGRDDAAAGGLTGGGPLDIDAGASFGGYGRVAGPVRNAGTVFVADALPAFGGGPTGTLAFTGGLDNGGTLDLRGAAPGNRLRVAGGYTGRGGSTLAISTVLAADDAATDRLVLDGGQATGSTRLAVSNAGGEGALTVANGIRVVDAVNGAVTEESAFRLDAPLLAGPYRYTLYKGGKNGTDSEDWFLRSEDTRPEPPDPPEPPVPPDPPQPTPDYREETAIYATLPGQALAYARSLQGSFHERMGDSAEGLAPGDGGSRLWGRAFGSAGRVDGRSGGTATDNPDQGFTLAGLEAGGDLLSLTTADGTRHAAGLSAAIGSMATEVTTRRGVEAGDTRMTAVSGGGYWTSLGARGWYVDARALASAYAASSTSFQDVEFDTTGLGVAASLEAGYPLALAPGLVLEPQLQAVAQGLWLGDGNDGYADVSFEDAASLATRAGLRIAYTRDGATGFGVTVWARGDVWHDWLEPAPEVRFSSADGPVGFHSETDATWLAARIGVSARDSERLQLHGSLGAERSADGNGFAMDARVGAVWRF